ncbi:MAG: 16S rRNA (cytosine(1402)-N(4))-methyltransferase [Clostridiales bacterium GWF2_36_10]|nr:MAG: 16S rRNA (cytosine(1402)-N(4))-methyltransferase [Clostridiales bacterium GWF2_36_10]HAN20343.1 16S rRNA (cytosine(1402)-N(4))-methyltransferase [Clostridiales bacterium]
MEFIHYPVMRDEVIEGLNIKPDGIYCDCTLGGGGHTRLILEKLSDKGRLISIDRDIAAIENAKRNINDNRLMLVKDNYTNIDSIIADSPYERLDGILMDLGVSSYQFDNAERGFSYRYDAPLDMRMDESDLLTAYEVVNSYSEKELAKILFDYGEERFGNRIAQRIVRERETEPIKTTLRLAGIISAAIPVKNRNTDGNPAKRSFQAIRIEVNAELEGIGQTIEKGVSLLKEGGRIAVISFHSLEDRIAKTIFKKLMSPCTCPVDFPVCVCNKKPLVKLISKKAITPSEKELSENSRSHSAKLRIAEKV